MQFFQQYNDVIFPSVFYHLFPPIILLFHFIFPFNNINVHQLSWYTCLVTFSTWYKFSNMKVYIAQGSWFLRWLDTVFQGQYLQSLSINYVAINKDLEKLPPQLY